VCCNEILNVREPMQTEQEEWLHTA
jgi:hypothetical protein